MKESKVLIMDVQKFSEDIIHKLEKEGWELVRVSGLAYSLNRPDVILHFQRDRRD